MFGRISRGRMVENRFREIVWDCWWGLPDHYPHVALDAFVVMPDHVHGIVILRDGIPRTGLKPARRHPTGPPHLIHDPLRPEPFQHVPHHPRIPAAKIIRVDQ